MEQEKLKDLSFSLIGETSSLDCVAPDESTFNYWVDDVNTLLRKSWKT